MPASLKLTALLCTLLTCMMNASCFAADLAPQYQKYNKDLGVNPQLVLDDLLLLSPPAENTLLRAQHHYTLSLTYLTLAYPKKSLDEANLAIENLANLDADWLYYSILVVKTQAMELSGQAKEALPLIKSAVQWATDNNDDELLIDALVGLGYIENTLRQSVKALDAFMQAYDLAPASDAIVTKSAIASSIALVYEYRKEDELAVPYFQESVDHHRKNKNLLELSIALYGLGRANKNLGKIELGTNQLQESLDISRAINDNQGVAYALKELAPLSIDNNEFEQAESMLNEAAKLFELSQNKFMLFDVYKTLTVLHLKNDAPLQAELSLDSAKRFLDPDRMTMQSITLDEIEAKLLAAQGQHELAYEQLSQTVDKKQQLQSAQSTEQLHQLRAQFELAEKAKTNQLLSQENAVQKLNLTKEKQHNQILIIVISAITVIVLLLLYMAAKSRKQKQLLFKSAHYDSLTGLANRSYILQQLEACQHQLGPKQSMYVAMLDLDHFKQINDQLGHDVGDQVLQAMGQICKQQITSPHLVGRFGGEEFLLAFIDIEFNEVENILETIRKQAESIHLKLDQGCPPIGFSVGVTACSSKETLKECIKAADLAMYQAKNSGRSRTVLSD